MKFFQKKHKAFTLMEAALAMLIVSIIVITMFNTLKPTKIKTDALRVAGVNGYNVLKTVSQDVVLYHSNSHSMEALKNISGTAFTLSDSNRNAYVSALYKKYLGPNSKTVTTAYTNTALKNEAGTAVGNFTISSFANGVLAKNGMYVAFRLNTNCTTTETNTVYDPSIPDKHTLTNSCGLILYDVNGMEQPNTVGIDIYIVSVGKFGLK